MSDGLMFQGLFMYLDETKVKFGLKNFKTCNCQYELWIKFMRIKNNFGHI